MLLPMRQIFQEMAAEKLRLGLTILAVAWATVSISVMLAVGEGIRQGVLTTVKNGNGNLMHLTSGMVSINHGSAHQGKKIKLLMSDVKVLSELPGIAQVAPSANWEERITFGDRTTWKTPLAVPINYQEMTHLKLLAGSRWFNPHDMKQKRKVMVIGYLLATSLFNSESDFNWFKTESLQTDPVGKKVKIGDEEFTIIGILQKNSGKIEQGYDINYSSFVPLTTWQRFHINGDLSAININPTEDTNRLELAKKIRQTIARKNGASVLDRRVVQVEDMLLKQESMRSFLVGLQGFLGIIGFITLAVAGIGIANVMYATVKRATRDIGLRMAVGATPTAIRLHYLLQSIMTMALGGLIGLGITYFLVSAIQSVNLDGNMLYERIGKPVPELSWFVVFIVIITLTLIGIVSAWLPANRAAKVSPLDALQSD
ncbi:peptide ABC transporter permease [Vibrio azureus]|uniref:ABC transporter permease protein n=1 Tax=Vibrio azureus NBRC 104587 TaxID=1219077 RepID=U3AXP4_9VIBR|nr:ABC transporter permease [Vibrio azureus]AUI88207.1 peptide ABC transporter permease [Vibrio azureus]GAD78002.1 hypothetical protein VAZ01S_108_00040 [Vibrio azureus NBRC 104587]